MTETFFGWSPTAWIAVLTVALTVIAVVQVCIYAKQAAYMRDGLALTTQAADAATKGAKTAEQALVLVNQPWLDTENWRIENRAHQFEFLSDSRAFMATCDIVNRGPAPAFIKWIKVRVRNAEATWEGGGTARIDNVVTTGGRHECRFKVPVAEEQSAWRTLIKAEVRGVIAYDDQFSTDTPRGSRYRRFGRLCIVDPHDADNPIFDSLPGSEGIGLKGEYPEDDWSDATK